MKGVILAAGKGTRLEELTENKPKALLKVGNKNCLEHIIEGMRDAGITDIIVVIGYQGQQIVDYFGDGNKLRVNLQYVKQSLDKYGTGYAGSLVEPLIDDSFMLSFGDIIITKDNYQRLYNQYQNYDNVSAVISLNWVDDPSEGGAVYIKEDGLVKKLVEKPPQGSSKTNWNSAGLFIFSPILFKYLKKISKSERGEYEISHAINLMINDGVDISSFKIDSYWQDIGTPEDYEHIQKILSSPLSKPYDKGKINLYKEKYRPQYHFSPKKNWANDPNGLVYYQGEYHLFYQHNPVDVVWGPMHWGHAVSKDLLYWEHLPIALKPDDKLGVIYSGSAVVDKNDSTGFFKGNSGLVAIYTSRLKTEEGSLQQQSIAYSKDNGRSWIKYINNPVIKNYGVADFRDPKVFMHSETGKWVMVVACGDRVRFYNSSDLKEWNYLSEFGSGIGSHGGVWECPDLIKLPVDSDKDGNTGKSKKKKWLLQVGDTNGGEAGVSVQYFVGEFDGEKFSSDYEKSFLVDYGQDLYSLQSWSNLPEGRNIWLGWMNNIGYQNIIPTTGWRGMMSIPREIKLREGKEGITLIQKPVKELKKLREKIYQKNNYNLFDTFTIDCKEQSYEIKAEIDINDAEKFAFALHKSGDQESLIIFNLKDDNIFINLSNSGNTTFSDNYLLNKKIEKKIKGKKLKINIFVDRSSIEIFLNDGEVVATNLVFPELKQTEIQLSVKGGSIKVDYLTIYKLSSIWRKTNIPQMLTEDL